MGIDVSCFYYYVVRGRAGQGIIVSVSTIDRIISVVYAAFVRNSCRMVRDFNRKRCENIFKVTF